MKKKLLILTLICFLLSLACGCNREIPAFLPGESEGDSQFVWVCKEPFSFFYPTDNYDDYWKRVNEYNERQEKEGLPPILYPTDTYEVCCGLLKGYIEKEGELVCFYSDFSLCDRRTYFEEEKIWGDPSTYECFWGYADYYENYFDLEIDGDLINFFGGELPELRFDKMTKEDFLEQYGEIENVSELLQLEPSDVDESVKL